MRPMALMILSAALAVPLAAAAGPSLLTNGSFEDGSALGMGSWTILNTLPGWQGDPSSGGGIELRRNAVGTAQDGSHFVELDTYRNSWMTQSVATEAGASYTLNWYYSPRAGVGLASNTIEVYWNGDLARLVYSTEGGRICPDCRQALADCRCAAATRQPAARRRPRARGRERGGRGGKTVTVVRGLALADAQITELGKRLRAACGSGGTAKDGVIEVQGDHVERVLALLLDGLTVAL
jgi:translation initiation factor 1